MRQVKAITWPLCLALAFSAVYVKAQVTWVPHSARNTFIPRNAIVAGKKHGVKLYVCRARLTVGPSPGESKGSACIVPYLGKAHAFHEFELATGSHYSWRRDRWDSAVIGGQQHGKTNLYVCRARVVQDSIDYGLISGKAFRFGPHAGHCYIPFRGKELDFTDHFELLHTPSKAH